MYDFNTELQRICKKYGLSVNDENVVDFYTLFIETFIEQWNLIHDSEPIAFYGAGLSFEHMSKSVNVRRKNVACIIENFESITWTHGIPVVKIDDINNYKFTKVILTGYTQRYEMKVDIHNYNANIEIIDIYEIMMKKGHKLDKPFLLLRNKYYYDLQAARLRYKNSPKNEIAQNNLKVLIQMYLEYRDFICADLYIKEYIERRFDNYDLLKSLRGELKLLLGKIKNALHDRKNKCIVVVIADGLSFGMSKKLPLLNKLSEGGLVFSNAFSPVYYTRPATYCYLTGGYYLKDELYQRENIGAKDSCFLTEMSLLGIKVKHISPHSFHYIEDIKLKGNPSTEIMTLQFWSLMTDMAIETADTIYFVHCMETHTPFLSGDTDVELLTDDELLKKDELDLDDVVVLPRMKQLKEDAIGYLNNQMEMYISMLPLEKDTIIVTSDHQENTHFSRLFGQPFSIDMEKVVLIIHSPLVPFGRHNDIYSTIHITKLVSQIAKGEIIELEKMDYVRQEIEPFYNKNLKKSHEFSARYKYGKVAFTTSVDRYVFYLNGDEEYYLLPDLETNLIEKEEHSVRIQYFRNQVQLDPMSVWKFMFKRRPHLKELHKDIYKGLLSI